LLNSGNVPLSLALLGGAGPAITFLSPVFDTSVRWLILLAVLVWAGTRGRAFAWLQGRTGGFILACLAWSLLTYLWSMQPTLTFMKAGGFILVVGALVTAGYRWTRTNALSDALSFLMPMMIASLLAAVLGRTQESSSVMSQGLDLYRGLTGNSNMLGSLMFMITPLLLWKVHSTRGRKRFVWAALLAVTLIMLALSVARSSILAILLMAGVYGLALPLARRTSIAFFGGLGIVTAFLMMPGTLGQIESRYVRKNVAAQSSQILFSREGPWEVSVAMAKQGGLFGAGYGVSINGGEFSGGLTTFGYGREKGNTQLAIVEETGIVGLALYMLIVVSLVARLWKAFSAAGDRNLRALIGIVTGSIVGELVIGAFEAWWVAPGSPESIWFWAMVGVALGLCNAVLQRPARRAAGEPVNPRMAASAVRR
jgi:O-antigen ligase